jgi:transposase-like protein
VDKIACPSCNHPVHEIFKEDNIRRWRCMACERGFSELEYQLGDGELIRRGGRGRHAAEVSPRPSQPE